MSLNYLLDGYNIIHHLPGLALKKLEDQRNDLIRFIEVHRPQGSSSNSVTIVFDGQMGIWGEPRSGGVKVVFSSGETADDYIKRAVSASLHKKNIVVVTNDRDIQLHVRSQGAQIKSVEVFLGTPKVLPGKKSQNSEKKPDSKYISKTLEHKITSEFEKIWTKKSKPA